jgi:secreted trypsin-like serine protease
MRSKSPATSLSTLVRPGKLALVLGVLLFAAVHASVSLALRARHPDGVKYAAQGTTHLGPAHLGDSGHQPFAHQAIVGGSAAQEGSFPSLAYVIDIQGKYVYQCTGTVVAPSLVLTAGHCAEDMRTGVVNKPSGYRIVTGAVDPLTPGASVSTVLGVIVFPGFARKVDDGDAALLVLSAPVTAPPITLATSSDMSHLHAGAAAVMVGWGITSFEQRLPTEALQSAGTVLQGRKWCAVNAPPFYPKSEICTIAPPSYATGVCSGDSGGPLLGQRPATGEAIQIGIAVHVYRRCSTHHPSVFVGISSISAWIHTWIDAYKLPPVSPSPVPTPSPAPPPTSPVPLSSSSSS